MYLVLEFTYISPMVEFYNLTIEKKNSSADLDVAFTLHLACTNAIKRRRLNFVHIQLVSGTSFGMFRGGDLFPQHLNLNQMNHSVGFDQKVLEEKPSKNRPSSDPPP